MLLLGLHPCIILMARAINWNLKAAGLFNRSYEVQITPLVSYGLGDGHMHIRTYLHKSNFRKPGACPPEASMHLVKKSKIKYSLLYNEPPSEA